MPISPLPTPINSRKRKSDDYGSQFASPPKRWMAKNYLSKRNEWSSSHRRSLDSMREHSNFDRKKRTARLTYQIHKNFWSNKKDMAASMYRRNEIRDFLSSKIRYVSNGAHVYIVGSSVNGLGFKSSGLDLLVFLDKSSDSGQLTLLRNIELIIKREKFVTEVQIRNEESNAPYVTFLDSVANIRVSIKVNQKTSVLSTKLIKTYTRIDNRVAPLIFIVKLWANHSGISAEKLLNGYSLSLMAIHFLQSGCQPAVLPESQTITRNEHEDFDFRTQRLYQSLPSFRSKNEESVGELLHNLLDYYGHKFAFADNVISIRTTRPILKSKHVETSDCYRKNPVYVEEPFDLSNTASAVDSDLAMQTIHGAFRRTLYELSSDDKYMERIF